MSLTQCGCENESNHVTAGLAVILSIGMIPIIASALRLGEIILSGDSAVGGPDWKKSDATWYVDSENPSNFAFCSCHNYRKRAWVPVWSQIEVNVGIVAASLPCLSPLFKQVFSHPRDSAPPTFAWYRGSLGGRSDAWDPEGDFEKGGNGKISEDELLNQVNILYGAKPRGDDKQ